MHPYIGLLCVQETPADRPAMYTAFQMLIYSSITLPVPPPPGFSFKNRPDLDPLSYGSELGQSSSKSIPYFTSDDSITRVNHR